MVVFELREKEIWRGNDRGEMREKMERYLERRGPNGLETVSYTHLTLPTKRIV